MCMHPTTRGLDFWLVYNLGMFFFVCVCVLVCMYLLNTTYPYVVSLIFASCKEFKILCGSS